MSEQISFDRKKGFVALPVEVLDLDLTPGSFRTLVELCRMANPDGWCWPSLDQLSQKLGRSRSSISGYLKDLREAGLVATQEQRTANGFNYRLKYQVTFWSDWRASLGPRKTAFSAQSTERSVQPVERSKDSKNQNHKNQTRGDIHDPVETVLRQWADCFRHAPYPTAVQTPSDELLKTSMILATSAPPESNPDQKHIDKTLKDMWSTLNVDCLQDAQSSLVEFVEKSEFSPTELTEICRYLTKNWPHHWRRLPPLEQFQKMVKASGVRAHSRKIQLLKSYQKRWDKAQKLLQRPAPSYSLALNVAAE